MFDPDLVTKVKRELEDDLDRYDGDWDVWSEVVVDCPSNTLESLIGQVPEDQVGKFFETVIIPYIRELE